MLSRKRIKPKSRKPTRTKAQKARKDYMSDFANRYNVLIELANASYELTFRQLLHGDASKVKRKIKKLYVKNVRSQKVSVPYRPVSIKRLNAVRLRLLRTKFNALLDSRAI